MELKLYSEMPGAGDRQWAFDAEGNLAERVGFEPTVRKNRTPDFESGAFDHSAISPGSDFLPSLALCRKGRHSTHILNGSKRAQGK